MPGAAVQVPLSGLSREIAAIASVTTDHKPLLRQWGLYLAAQAKRRFVNQSAPDGTAWAPLKAPRNRPRDKRKNKLPSGRAQGGQKILRDSGLLMGSVGGQSAQGSVQRITDTTIEQGTNLFYAGFHQYGTRHMVARPFVGVNEQDADKLALMTADFFGGR